MSADSRYEVIVGNVGTVYDGPRRHEAMTQYAQYVSRSQAGDGRAADEPVTLLKDGEIIREHTPPAAACDECGRMIPAAAGSMINRWHADSCSLHSGNVSEA